MKRYKLGVAAIAVSIMMAFFSIEVWAVETVSGNDVNFMSDREIPEECIGTIDVSDMVYQAGGWGVPISDRPITMYALEQEDVRAQLMTEFLLALQQEEEMLDVSGYDLNIDDLEAVKILYAELLNEHPELFYASSEIRYSYYVGSGKLANIYLSYLGTTEEERQEYIKMVEQATGEITSGMTDVEKALALHDFLAQNCAYAYSEYLEGTLDSCPNVYNAYGALVEGKAVCQGYAVAYNSLLRAVGIPSEICSSDAMNHAWNLILLDGEWYHVDVTWDDPVWNTEGKVQHIYFLLSDSEMNNREHYDWESMAECTSTKYDGEDYWWSQIDSQIVLGEKQYYIEELDSGFQLTEKDGEEETAKYVNSTVWNVWDGGGYWSGSFAYLSKQGDSLYFNDKLNLYEMSLTDSTPSIVYTYEGGEGYIYGAMVYGDGTARLNIATTPNRKNDDYITVVISEENPGTNSGTINGNIIFSGSETDSITLRLLDSAGAVVSETIVTGNGSQYTLEDVLSGTYIMQVSAPNHVIREYIVTVDKNTLKQNVEIYLTGDISGDGKINAMDKKMLYNHIAKVAELSDYAVSVADVSGDGKVNARDKKLLYNQIANIF